MYLNCRKERPRLDMAKSMTSRKHSPAVLQPRSISLSRSWRNPEAGEKALDVPGINHQIDHIWFLNFKRFPDQELYYFFYSQYGGKLETFSKVAFTMRPKTEDIIKKNYSFLKNPGPGSYASVNLLP